MANIFKRFFVFVFILISQESFSDTVPTIRITKKFHEKKMIDQSWSYKNGDDLNYAKSDLNDNDWDTINPFLGEESMKLHGFTGKCWFRIRFVVDTNCKIPTFVFSMYQKGASEVYINGKLVEKFGNYGGKEEWDTGENDPLYFTPDIGKINVIAIRYENSDYEHSYGTTGELMGGFYCSIEEPETYFETVHETITGASIYGLGLFSFLFSIGLVHFLLYIFYRARKSNLRFTIFSFLFAYYFLHFFLTTVIVTEPITKSLMVAFFVATVPFFFLSLLNLLYSLFYEKNPKLFRYLFIAALVSSVFLFTRIKDIGYLIGLLLVFVTIIEVVRVTIVALRKRKRGAVIISLGFGAFALFLAMVFATMFLNHGSFNLKSGSAIQQIYYVCFLLAVVSVPLSMSIFLAWDFSQTNKTLSKKLVEVEELSAKSIEQEKEKQKILAQQNEVLEVQVEERTKEINEQKKVIEEKNKDITDSINYAQRIQRSILPTQEEIKNIFKESFVLFKPRDIVSGDFYQFKRTDDHHYAILADCTGHGVPGALMSMIGSNLLKQIIIERGVKEPDKILSALHKEVRSTLRQGTGMQSHDGMDASIVLNYKNKLFIASANRPVYIIKNNELTELKPDKRSIGGSSVGDDISFNVNELDVEPGMMVYLFSDGYADQFGGDAGKKFKVKNLSSLLLSIHSKPLEIQKEILNTTFDEWKKYLEQVDDVCLIGLRF